jgi:hypothetical protein
MARLSLSHPSIFSSFGISLKDTQNLHSKDIKGGMKIDE